MKRLSVLYGGGFAPDAKGEPKIKTSSAPLNGDPLDDIIARLYAEGTEKGYSKEEITMRLHKVPEVAEVTLIDSDIIINGIALSHLKPSVRAFYILVARHPEGIEKEKYPGGLLKDGFRKYLDEYESILNELKGACEKSVFDKSKFNIDSRFPHYRDKVNKTIKEVEDNNGGLNLSSCKVVGTRCMYISAKVIDLVGLHTVPPL